MDTSSMKKLMEEESQIEIKMVGALQRFGFTIQKQVKIGKYRVDILIEGRDCDLVVECDGAEFHTDQEKEKERDEYLIKLGYSVMHLTGSEIYRKADYHAFRIADRYFPELWQTEQYKKFEESEKQINKEDIDEYSDY